MDTIFKTFMGIVLLFMVTLSGTGLIAAAIDAKHADTYAASVVTNIEESHFSSVVMQQAILQAQQYGYDITYQSFDNDRDQMIDLVEVSLNYEYKIPFLCQKGVMHTLKAYAR